MNSHNFQNNLRSLRKAKGLTQKEMSQLLNIQRQSYCNYENGHRMPAMDLLVKIADVFSISIDILVRGSVDPQAPISPDLPVLTQESIRLLTNYQRLPPSARKELQEYLAFKLQRSAN